MQRIQQRSSSPLPIEVWVPEYFCNQSLGPLRELKVRLFFYPVDQELMPDWVKISEKIGTGSRPDLFILVHYFGNVFPTEQARKFCDEQNCWLIEDAAHVFRLRPGIGERGDYVLLSPHKWLGLEAGAVLISKHSENLPKFNDRKPSFRGWKVGLKAILKNLLPGFLKKKRIQAASSEDFSLDPESVPGDFSHGLSKMEERLLAAFTLKDIEQVPQLRQQNESQILALIQSLAPELKPWHREPGSLRDRYTIVLKAPDLEIARARFSSFRQSGVFSQSWPDLPPEVLARNEDAGNWAIYWRNRLITIPTHQGLKK